MIEQAISDLSSDLTRTIILLVMYITLLAMFYRTRVVLERIERKVDRNSRLLGLTDAEALPPNGLGTLRELARALSPDGGKSDPPAPPPTQ